MPSAHEPLDRRDRAVRVGDGLALGVRRLPSALGMTFASLPSINETTELVVPRSMPMIFSVTAISKRSFRLIFGSRGRASA
jgi:hypothetical protein